MITTEEVSVAVPYIERVAVVQEVWRVAMGVWSVEVRQEIG